MSIRPIHTITILANGIDASKAEALREMDNIAARGHSAAAPVGNAQQAGDRGQRLPQELALQQAHHRMGASQKGPTMSYETVAEIQAWLDAYMARVKAVTEQPYTSISFDFHPHAGPSLYVSAFPTNEQFIRGDTPAEVFATAEAYIAAMPSVAEQRKIAWMRDLGKLIDKGRDIGIEADFVNPLEVAMRALSENVLTFTEAAE